MPLIELRYKVKPQLDYVEEMDKAIHEWVRKNLCVHVSRDWEAPLSKFSKVVFPCVAAWPWTKTYICHTVDHGSTYINTSSLPCGVYVKRLVVACMTP